MPFDILNEQNLNPSVRFYFEDSEDEWVELKLASEQDNKELFKRVGIKSEKKLVYNKSERQMQYVRDIDASDSQQDKFNEEVWDFSIYNWNLVTPDGKEIECTRENKVKLMRKSPKFASWIGDCLEKMREGLPKVKTEEIKN